MDLRFCTLVYFFLHYRLVSAAIRLNGNGYEGVIVTIADHVQNDPTFLTLIQDWLTAASKKLYIASRYHVYLKEITIRVPDHWNNKNKYKLTNAPSTKTGDIYIEDLQLQDISAPYVRGLPGCGLKGLYMRFTTDVLRKGNRSGYGSLDSVFVHEWGHLRWGLFDEYPTKKDKLSFYLHNGKWEPIRCTTKITGTIRNLRSFSQAVCINALNSGTGPNSKCIFVPDTFINGASAPVASLMGSAYIPTLSQFCDGSATDISLRHNDIAPNNQNMKCGRKSSWDVMMENDDFKSTSPGNQDMNTRPQFHIEQKNGLDKICLLIDVSGSMADVIDEARIATATVIWSVLPNASYVSIVTFSTMASTRKPVTKIVSDTTRRELIARLPTSTSGSTSIGAGLQECKSVLLGLSDLQRSRIYLASDGKENERPYIADVMPDIIENNIIIDTLAISDSADAKLRQISRDTGGQSYFSAKNSRNSTALLDSLMEPFIQSTSDPILRIMSDHIEVTAGNEAVEKTFYIDDSIGRETVIQLTSKTLNNVNMTVLGPNFIQSSVGTSADLNVLIIKILDKAKVGEYIATVSSRSTDISGTLSVLSKAAKPGQAVLETSVLETPEAFNFSSDMHYPLFVSLFMGSFPVSQAKVKAYIENPKGNISVVELKDNAVGADVLSHDGLYSAYILPRHLTSNGRHSIKVIVVGKNASVVGDQSLGTDGPFETEQVTEKVIGSFMRVALSNEIVVNGYFSIDSSVDNLPPAPILTFELAEIRSNNEFLMRWQAVGDDFDSGSASAYDVRISIDLTEMRKNPNNQTSLDVAMVPKESGEVEEYIFTLETIKSNMSYYISIRAVDEAGNVGDLSNIVAVSVLTEPTIVKDNDTSSHYPLLIGLVGGSVFIGVVLFILIRYALFVRKIDKYVV